MARDAGNLPFRIVIFDSDWVERLSDVAVIDRIVAVEPSLQYRATWLHEIALASREERQKKMEHAAIWQVPIRSARHRV